MYTSKNFSHLFGLTGFTDALLQNHFTLYEGYVANVNKLNDALEELRREEKYTTPEYAEINRRFGWEWNGMRLHELYFGNVSKESSFITEEKGLSLDLIKKWGSLEAWEKDFRSMMTIRGIGWVILYRDVVSGELFHSWVNEHDGGHLAGSDALLVMDVFEHAYMLDYGIKRAEYIDQIMQHIDFTEVEKRFVASIEKTK